jgi:hypothetical protein
MTEKSENIGEYVTMPQLMQILGGADQPGVKEMGTNYGTRCEQYGPPMISWNSWLQTDMYLYIKALLTSGVEKTWEEVASSHNSVNIWEERRRECIAKKNYALAYGLRLDKVTAEDIANSAEGSDYWVDAKVVLAAGSLKNTSSPPGLAAKAKPKAKTAEGKQKPKGPHPETLLKNFLAEKASKTLEVSRIRKSVSESPEEYKWAQGFMEGVEAALVKIDSAMDDTEENFAQKFLANSISATALRKLKKETENYDDLIEKLLATLRPPMAELTAELGKVVAGEQTFMGIGGNPGIKGKRRPPASPASGNKVSKRAS